MLAPHVRVTTTVPEVAETLIDGPPHVPVNGPASDSLLHAVSDAAMARNESDSFMAGSNELQMSIPAQSKMSNGGPSTAQWLRHCSAQDDRASAATRPAITAAAPGLPRARAAPAIAARRAASPNSPPTTRPSPAASS